MAGNLNFSIARYNGGKGHSQPALTGIFPSQEGHIGEFGSKRGVIRLLSTSPIKPKLLTFYPKVGLIGVLSLPITAQFGSGSLGTLGALLLHSDSTAFLPALAPYPLPVPHARE